MEFETQLHPIVARLPGLRGLAVVALGVVALLAYSFATQSFTHSVRSVFAALFGAVALFVMDWLIRVRVTKLDDGALLRIGVRSVRLRTGVEIQHDVTPVVLFPFARRSYKARLQFDSSDVEVTGFLSESAADSFCSKIQACLARTEAPFR